MVIENRRQRRSRKLHRLRFSSQRRHWSGQGICRLRRNGLLRAGPSSAAPPAPISLNPRAAEPIRILQPGAFPKSRRQEDSVQSTLEVPVKDTMARPLADNAKPGEAVKDDRTGKYLAFHLGREEFAIRVLKVREIMGVLEITAVPQMPEYVKGVINLRGKVIPVVDLRRKFGLPGIEYDQKTCIIVVQVRGEAGPMLMGIVVDGVTEVVNLAPGDIEDTPDFGGGGKVPYLLGMAKSKGRVRILLDIDQVLCAGELQGLEAVLG
jgi:purine-binding chemotaxis protein CheW